MKPDLANSKALDLVGNGSQASAQQILTATLKRWRKTLAYCSIFSAVPAVLASHVLSADVSRKQQTRSTDDNKPDATVARWPGRFQRLTRNLSKPALLKRQTEFRLPHQDNKFDPLAALGGDDNCPGRAIAGGTYTAAAPYTDAGDTTGANNTITRFQYYYYYSQDTLGPDHIYSFTLTARGPNPKIEVSATSPGYRPLIYVLYGDSNQACPVGTGNTVSNVAVSAGSGSDGRAIIDSNLMGFVPLDTPLFLVIDSNSTGPDGKGGYSIRMQDVTIPSPACPNPVDCAEFFVRQHYSDFLGREPDPEGLNFWTNEIAQCGSDAQCTEVKRINVSAAFFLSIEFQESGYLVYRMYKAAYGDLPLAPVPLTRQEFLSDSQRIGQGVVVGKPGWQQQLLNNKNAFASEFVSRSRFTDAFPTGLSPAQFVDSLNANTGGALSQGERDQLVNELVAGVKTRAQVLRAVAEDADFARSEFNKAFVLMQYFGYLHRNPNDPPDRNFDGYNFWLDKLNLFNGNFVQAEMVKAFISSLEYKARFGQQ